MCPAVINNKNIAIRAYCLWNAAKILTQRNSLVNESYEIDGNLKWEENIILI